MNLERLLAKRFSPIAQHISQQECILYSLGIGIGAAPGDRNHLQFTYEDGLKVFPSMVNVISHPGAWLKEPELEVDWVKILHGEQSFRIHRPLDPGKTYVGSYRINGVIDKGAGKGAMLYLEKQLREKDHEDVVSTVTSTYVLRGDGGCGSTIANAPPVHSIPERPADFQCTVETLPQAALIYRLSGDYNPIHADPGLAKKAGFERPILHGLCSFGVATRAILQTCCDNRPERLGAMQLRFSAPVYPGETVVTEIWRDGEIFSFRSRVAERDVIVLNNGRAEVQAA